MRLLWLYFFAAAPFALAAVGSEFLPAEFRSYEAMIGNGRYAEARQHLQQYLDSDQRLEAVYLLALLEEEQGNYPAAVRWYAELAEQESDLALQSVADEALLFIFFVTEEVGSTDDISPDLESRIAIGTHVSLNDGLSTAAIDSQSDVSDASISYRMALSSGFWRSERYRFGGSLLVWEERFQDFEQYDFRLLVPELHLQYQSSRHEWRVSLDHGRTWEDGEDSISETGLDLSVRHGDFARQGAANFFAWRVSHQWSAAESDVYEPYDGTKTGFEFGLDRENWLTTRVRFRLQDYDRTDGYFFTGLQYRRPGLNGTEIMGELAQNYSRQSVGMQVDFSWFWSDSFYQVVQLSFDEIKYDLPVRVLELSSDGVNPPSLLNQFLIDRKDEAVSAAVSLFWEASKSLLFSMDFYYSDNRSSIPGSPGIPADKPFDYDSSVFSLGVEWAF